MVSDDILYCPKCGASLKFYDTVPRIIRTKGRSYKYIKLRRLRCLECSAVHREIPSIIFPYKQYEAEIIRGVLEGFITPETYGYEDYPSEMAMVRWRTQKIHLLL